VADAFITLALLLIAFVAFAMGLEPQFNGPVANAAVVFLFLGVIADGALRRFRRRGSSSRCEARRTQTLRVRLIALFPTGIRRPYSSLSDLPGEDQRSPG
jgi:hypothetical protein